jgi:hypothetical protein
VLPVFQRAPITKLLLNECLELCLFLLPAPLRRIIICYCLTFHGSLCYQISCEGNGQGGELTLAASRSHLFVMNQFSQLWVMKENGVLVEVGTHSLCHPRYMTISDDRLYVVDIVDGEGSAIHVFQICDPKDPQRSMLRQIHSFPVSSSCSGVAVHRNLIYLCVLPEVRLFHRQKHAADEAGGVVVLTTSGALVSKWKYPSMVLLQGIAVHKETVYVGDFSRSWLILLSLEGRLIREISLDCRVTDVSIYHDLVYVFALKEIRVLNETGEILQRIRDSRINCRGFAWMNDLCFLSNFSQQIHVYQ